jgi:transposase
VVSVLTIPRLSRAGGDCHGLLAAWWSTSRLSHEPQSPGGIGYDRGIVEPMLEVAVAPNFRPVQRDQLYLMPVSMRDWLPSDDLVWAILDAVEELDLEPLRARYRADGWGAAAYDPAMMTALLLYAYATGERSSRGIERRCRREIGYRVISGGAAPDHATIARFRAEHATALAGLFGEVLRLCARAGMGRLGLVALDGTKIAANASPKADRSAAALDAEIARMLGEAAATDASEDAAAAAGQGPIDPAGGLPAHLAEPSSRLARFREARRQLAEEEAARLAEGQAKVEAWEAREAAAGRRLPGRRPRLDAARRRGWDQRNTTDPEARRMKAGAGGWLTGYNAQAMVAKDGVVLATAVSQQVADVAHLAPMLAATESNVARAGMRGFLGTLLADAGYRSEANLALEGPDTPRFLIPEASTKLRTVASARPRLPLGERMDRRLGRATVQATYRRRGVIVEPLFGHVKEVLRFRRFSRRGLAACASEWAIVCTAHNLLKLWRHGRRPLPWASGPSGGPSARWLPVMT